MHTFSLCVLFRIPSDDNPLSKDRSASC